MTELPPSLLTRADVGSYVRTLSPSDYIGITNHDHSNILSRTLHWKHKHEENQVLLLGEIVIQHVTYELPADLLEVLTLWNSIYSGCRCVTRSEWEAVAKKYYGEKHG